MPPDAALNHMHLPLRPATSYHFKASGTPVYWKLDPAYYLYEDCVCAEVGRSHHRGWMGLSACLRGHHMRARWYCWGVCLSSVLLGPRGVRLGNVLRYYEVGGGVP